MKHFRQWIALLLSAALLSASAQATVLSSDLFSDSADITAEELLPDSSAPSFDATIPESPAVEEDIPGLSETIPSESPTEEEAAPETPEAPLPELPAEEAPLPELPTEEELLPEDPPAPTVVRTLLIPEPLPTVNITQNFYSDIRPLTEFLEQLSSIPAEILAPDGSVSIVMLDVNWDLPQEYTPDPAEIGFYPQTGTLVFPDETYVLGAHVSDVLTLPVIVSHAEFEVTAFDFPEDLASFYLLEQNGDLSEITDELPTLTDCYDTLEIAHRTCLNWDFSAVDPAASGCYIATATPELPLHSILSENISLPVLEVNISVQSSSEPELHGFHTADDGFFFPWITPACGTEGSVIALTADGEPAEDLSMICVDSNGLFILRDQLNPNTVYTLCVFFEDCMTGLLTFTYNEVEDTLELLDYDDSIRTQAPPADELPEESLPEELPPEPILPSEPAAPTEPPAKPEAEDPPRRPVPQKKDPEPSTPSDVHEIMGGELLMMLSDGPAQFSLNQMTVLFSKESIRDLDVNEKDVFSVIIKNEGKNTFSIAVTRNGIFVEDCKDLQVQLPYTPKQDSFILTLQDQDGNSVAEGTYDDETGLAVFTVHHTGQYTIVEKETVNESAAPVVTPQKPVSTPGTPSITGAPAVSPSAPTANAASLLPITAIFLMFLILAASTVVFRRKREAV